MFVFFNKIKIVKIDDEQWKTADLTEVMEIRILYFLKVFGIIFFFVHPFSLFYVIEQVFCIRMEVRIIDQVWASISRRF